MFYDMNMITLFSLILFLSVNANEEYMNRYSEGTVCVPLLTMSRQSDAFCCIISASVVFKAGTQYNGRKYWNRIRVYSNVNIALKRCI